jgi:prevent-host-death family protein
MKQVGIAELKTNLSECLRAVRRGQTIAILDRETPIAKIVPISERATLLVRKPAPGAPAPNCVPLPEPLKIKIEVLDLLLEERQSYR